MRELAPAFANRTTFESGGQPPHPKIALIVYHPISEIRKTGPIPPQSRQKTPAIVHNQGISRHPLKNESSPHRRATPTRHAPSPPSLDVGCWIFRPAAPSASIRVHLRSNPPFSRIRAFRGSTSPQSRQKTPAIVHNQGISRHPLKNESSPHRRAIPTRHAPSPPSLDVGRGGRPQGLLVDGCFGQIPHLRLSASILQQVDNTLANKGFLEG